MAERGGCKTAVAGELWGLSAPAACCPTRLKGEILRQAQDDMSGTAGEGREGRPERDGGGGYLFFGLRPKRRLKDLEK